MHFARFTNEHSIWELASTLTMKPNVKHKMSENFEFRPLLTSIALRFILLTQTFFQLREKSKLRFLLAVETQAIHFQTFSTFIVAFYRFQIVRRRERMRVVVCFVWRKHCQLCCVQASKRKRTEPSDIIARKHLRFVPFYSMWILYSNFFSRFFPIHFRPSMHRLLPDCYWALVVRSFFSVVAFRLTPLFEF